MGINIEQFFNVRCSPEIMEATQASAEFSGIALIDLAHKYYG
jgi:hypothetical protein